MKWIWLISLSLVINTYGQGVIYSPNRTKTLTVSADYYDTEYIYLENTENSSISIHYQLIENTLDPQWQASLCTNTGCYAQIPKTGTLGTISSGGSGMLSFNFSSNGILGNGYARFLITSPELPNMKDTVTFDYTVTEDGKAIAQPWAKVNYSNSVLTVLVQNPGLETQLSVFNTAGHIIFQDKAQSINAIPLYDRPTGIYIVYIRDEYDRIIRKKISHISR